MLKIYVNPEEKISYLYIGGLWAQQKLCSWYTNDHTLENSAVEYTY